MTLALARLGSLLFEEANIVTVAMVAGGASLHAKMNETKNR